MKLSRDEAIKLHREMWNYIAQKEEEAGHLLDIDERYELKKK